MKKILVLLGSVVCLAAIVLHSSSCGKEKQTAPNISLVVDSTRYISSDTTLVRFIPFTVGLRATKTGTDGLLTSMVIVRNRNGGADSTLQEMTFITQSFSQFYTYKAPDSGNVERYTFTVAEQDGMTNSLSLAITGK